MSCLRVCKRFAGGKLALLAVCGMSFAGFAQTADVLKTRFATLFGPNKYARIVWQVEGCYKKPNADVGCPNGQQFPTTMMALDTKDGIVRQLAGPKSGTHYSGASFTWDGKRVVWDDNIKFQYLITDFLDTAKKRVFLNGYEGDGRCYRPTDSTTDWILATEAKNQGKLYRINVDDTTKKVLLFSPTWARLSYAGTTCWADMSRGGKCITGGWPNYGKLGWVTVGNTTTVTAPQSLLDDDGCWPSIAPDTTGDMLYCPANDPDYHRAVRIINRSGTQLARPNLLTAGLLGAAAQYYESLRWTNDRSFVALFAYTNQGSNDGMSSIGVGGNPKIIDIVNMRGAAIVDNPTFPQGNPAVFIYTCPGSDLCGTSVILPQSKPTVAARPVFSSGAPLAGKVFSLTGRSAAGLDKLRPGVYVKFLSSRTMNEPEAEKSVAK